MCVMVWCVVRVWWRMCGGGGVCGVVVRGVCCVVCGVVVCDAVCGMVVCGMRMDQPKRVAVALGAEQAHGAAFLDVALHLAVNEE